MRCQFLTQMGFFSFGGVGTFCDVSCTNTKRVTALKSVQALLYFETRKEASCLFGKRLLLVSCTSYLYPYTVVAIVGPFRIVSDVQTSVNLVVARAGISEPS